MMRSNVFSRPPSLESAFLPFFFFLLTFEVLFNAVSLKNLADAAVVTTFAVGSWQRVASRRAIMVKLTMVIDEILYDDDGGSESVMSSHYY
jgi:hypothetical protein